MKSYTTGTPMPLTADRGQTGCEPISQEKVATPLVPALHTILVPVDFTPDSEKALAYAVYLARQFGARVTLLHVSQVQFCGSEFAYMPIEDRAICDGIRTRLDALVQRKLGSDLLGATLVRHGVPFEVIACVAREINAGMIVVSTHGYTGLKHIVAGSTAERVVRHAPCPVLVVHAHERDFV